MLLDKTNPLNIVAAIAPVVAFLTLIIFTIFRRRRWNVHIEKITENINVVGISGITTKETFFEDDAKLWKQFKTIRTKTNIPNKKEQYSFVTVKRKLEDNLNKFEYIFGPIVYDFSNIPTGMVSCVIPKGLYANVHIHIRNENTWKESIEKVQKQLYEKWIPKSRFVIDDKKEIMEIEYHEKPSENSTKTIMFYIPIKNKEI